MNSTNTGRGNFEPVAKFQATANEDAPDSTVGTVMLCRESNGDRWRVFVVGGILPDGRVRADFIPAPMALEYFLSVCRDCVVDAVELVEELEDVADAGTRETGGQS